MFITRKLFPRFSRTCPLARKMSSASGSGVTAEGRSLSESQKQEVSHQAAKQEGDRVPSVTFKVRVRDPSMGSENPFKWKDVTSEQLFEGKRVVVFGLPGAFTPTCDGSHVPGYHEKYQDIRGQNVDEIYCVSVNDAFVMRKWGLALGLEEEIEDATNPLNPGNFKTVKLIPDGATHFTRGMGMNCLWDTQRGFGERSWRYSMLVENMIIKKLFIEAGKVTADSAEDPFEVSDAETMLNYLKTRYHEAFISNDKDAKAENDAYNSPSQ